LRFKIVLEEGNVLLLFEKRLGVGRRGEATNLEKLPNNKNYSLIPSARNYSKWIMSVQ